MPLIKVENLSVGYENGAVAEGFNFSVDEGRYLCIVGENGAGKTTLMRTLLGLQAPKAGSIEFAGGLKSNEIGYLPQQTDIQRDFPASVYEVVVSGCQGRKGFMPFYSKADKDAALKAMERMGIEDLKDRCYRELSGGQQQRVLLARALCASSRLMVLDEPVAGLDPAAASEMYALIKELNDEGMAIIMISHDMSAAVQYADHVLLVSDEVFFGTTEEFKESEKGRAFIEGGAANDR